LKRSSPTAQRFGFEQSWMSAEHTGWRIGELLRLRVRPVDLLGNVIRREPGTTKNDGRALLSECVSGKQPDDHVFSRPNGSPVKDFRETWRNACIVAGVSNLLFHDLRRTAARNLRRAGVAKGVTMKIGGWRTRSVFERYAIVSQSDISEAMRKLEFRQNEHSFGHSESKHPDSAATADSANANIQ
jgi:integrase